MIMLIDSYVLHSIFDINFQGQNRKGNKTINESFALEKLKMCTVCTLSIMYSSKVPTFTIVWMCVCHWSAELSGPEEL